MSKANSQDLKWQEIKFYIELKIIRGELKSGDKLPSVREAAADYNITKETAAKVYIKLEEEVTEQLGKVYKTMQKYSNIY